MVFFAAVACAQAEYAETRGTAGNGKSTTTASGLVAEYEAEAAAAEETEIGASARARPGNLGRGRTFRVKDGSLGTGNKEPSKAVEVTISKSKYPESAQHIEDATKDGHPDTLTIKRSGAAANRKESLKGVDTVKGKDRDEYPPAMFEEGGKGASVRPITSSDNRGAGSSMGQQLRSYPDGTKVKIKVVE